MPFGSSAYTSAPHIDKEFVLLPKLPGAVVFLMASTAAPAGAPPTADHRELSRRDAIAGHREPSRRQTPPTIAHAPRAQATDAPATGGGGAVAGAAGGKSPAVGAVGGSGTGPGTMSASTQAAVKRHNVKLRGLVMGKQLQPRGHE